ncbi:MAG: DUF5709 domain-containing protein [Jatrophihabitantaceae bacterium]
MTDDMDPIENLTGDDPSLDEQLSREEPEIPEDGADDAPDPRAGRLVSPDEGGLQDTESDETAEDVGPAGDASSAEEAPVHLRPDS